jgi:hypothetical protein
MSTKTLRKPSALVATFTSTPSKLTYKFKNGAQITGTVEQIVSFGAILKEKVDLLKIKGGVPQGYYNSSSKGLIKITDMHDTHLRNSIVKASISALNDLQNSKTLSNKQFLNRWTTSGNSVKITELVNELTKRSK